MRRFLPDTFTILLVCTVILASLLPASGTFADYFGIATDLAIALLFSCMAPACRATWSYPACCTGACISSSC